MKIFFTIFLSDLWYLYGFWSKMLQQKHNLILKIQNDLLSNFLLQKLCQYLKSGTKKSKIMFFDVFEQIKGSQKVQGSIQVKKEAYPYFENKVRSFKYICYQNVLCFGFMFSEKVILYNKWCFLFFAPLRMIFHNEILLNIFSEFHLKKNITKVCFFKDLEGNIIFFQKMSISRPDLR